MGVKAPNAGERKSGAGWEWLQLWGNKALEQTSLEEVRGMHQEKAGKEQKLWPWGETHIQCGMERHRENLHESWVWWDWKNIPALCLKVLVELEDHCGFHLPLAALSPGQVYRAQELIRKMGSNTQMIDQEQIYIFISFFSFLPHCKVNQNNTVC